MSRKLIEEIDEIRVNIRYFDKRIEKQDEDAFNFVKRRINFIVYRNREEYRFVPSRFVGYPQNTFSEHKKDPGHGGRTTGKLSLLLGEPDFNEAMKKRYNRYSEKLGVKPDSNKRRFWSEEDFQVLPSNEKPIEDDSFEYEYIKRLSRKGHLEFRREAMELWVITHPPPCQRSGSVIRVKCESRAITAT